MDSREVLEEALEGFEGTIIAISHDRYFINRFARKVCVLEDGRLKEYLGNYDDYFAKISRDQAPDGDLPLMTRTAADREKKKSREEQRREKERKERLKALEKEIADAEKEAEKMEARLADPETYRDPEEGARLTREYHQKKAEIDRLYEAWADLEG